MARSGTYIKQLSGDLEYKAFIPNPLPPKPAIKWDDELIVLNSQADRMLARLDGVSDNLPSVGLFVYIYARKEAVLSSQIEGTQASLSDIMKAEADIETSAPKGDVLVTTNHFRAMTHGLERLESLPISLRLIREIHKILLEGVRGQERTPGEFRRSQNWIGPEGRPLSEALFVPPPEHEMKQSLGDFERFLHDKAPMPPLIKVGLAHAQIETIHPFLDGNGRIGRLLIIFLLCAWGILQYPVMYPSLALKARRSEYYGKLQAVRDDGDWEGWLKFFLSAMTDAARDAHLRTKAICNLREAHRSLLDENEGRKAGGHKLLEQLFQRPFMTIRYAAEQSGLSVVTAGKLMERFEDYGILEETTGRDRDRVYRYTGYLDLLERDLDDK